jgi:hypothetical protein
VALNATEDDLVLTLVVDDGDLILSGSKLAGREVLHLIPQFVRSTALNHRVACDKSGYNSENAESPRGEPPQTIGNDREYQRRKRPVAPSHRIM